MDFNLNRGHHKKTLAQLSSGLSFGLNCPNPKAPKLALCVAGLSRSFVSTSWTSMYKEQILQPVAAAGCVGLTRTDPDVFVHVKLGGFDHIASDREHSGHNLANKMEYALKAVQEINASDFVIEEGWGDAHDRQKLGNPSCFHPHGSVEGVMSYYRSILGCLNLIKKAENDTGAKYDVIMFSRPDEADIFGTEQEYKIRSIQCSKSLFAGDAKSYQTRAAFEIYGNIYNDQFANPHPSLCGMNQNYEHFVMDCVTRIQQDVGAAEYGR